MQLTSFLENITVDYCGTVNSTDTVILTKLLFLQVKKKKIKLCNFLTETQIEKIFKMIGTTFTGEKTCSNVLFIVILKELML